MRPTMMMNMEKRWTLRSIVRCCLMVVLRNKCVMDAMRVLDRELGES
jgi:hypothetical protein